MYEYITVQNPKKSNRVIYSTMTVWAKNGEIMRNKSLRTGGCRKQNYVPSRLKVTFLKCFFTLALQSRWRFLRSSSEMLIFSLLAARNIFFYQNAI